MLDPCVMIPCSSQDLRWLKPSEAEIFAEWEKKERPYPWNEHHFLETLKSSSQKTLVWEEGGKLYGFAVVQIVQSEAYLLNIMISHEKRRHGYGKTLLQKIMRWLKESGVNKLVLDVDPENLPAVFLYKKVGFHTLARRTKSYPNGEDSLLMNKDL